MNHATSTSPTFSVVNEWNILISLSEVRLNSNFIILVWYIIKFKFVLGNMFDNDIKYFPILHNNILSNITDLL